MTYVLQAQILIDPRLVTLERLQDLLARLQDASAILQDLGELIEGGIAENFETEGFGSWAPLADSTVADKSRKNYGDQPPLVRTGKLRDALSQQDAPGHKFLVGPDSVDVGVYPDMVPYAKRLASGFGLMPGRILVQVGPDMRERIVQAIVDWLGGGDGVRVTMNAYSGITQD